MAGVARRVIRVVDEAEIKEGGRHIKAAPFFYLHIRISDIACQIAAHFSSAGNDKRKIAVRGDRNTKM